MLISVDILRKYSKQYGHSEALVIAELSVSPATKEELAERMDRTTRTIQSYLKPLVQAGLIVKNHISHVWSLSPELLKEIYSNEKKISNTNIHTDKTIIKSNKIKSNLETAIITEDEPEETFQPSKKDISQDDAKSNITSVEQYKAARLACTIMFGQALDAQIKELTKLLSQFQTIDLALIVSAAHVVVRNARSNPIMMFISTYRNKVQANKLMQLIKAQPIRENSLMDTKNSCTKNEVKNAFVGGKTNNKYDVFYDLYEKKQA